MSYEKVTPHEIRISKNLARVGKKLDKMLEKATGAPCYFILNVNSKAAREAQGNEGDEAVGQMAVGSYIANSDRETSSMIMIELLMKWEANGDIPPIHELKDASGRTLADIVGSQDQ